MASTNHPKDWIRIATEIELNYSFDAFVILHGTDTMGYTASALSFLLEDLGKTVVKKNYIVYCCDLTQNGSRYLPEHKSRYPNYGTTPLITSWVL